MIALARREDAAVPAAEFRSGNPRDQWRDAVKIRQEWLGHGLSTEPADRLTAERSLNAIYAKISRPRPKVVWVDSPEAAIPLVTGLPTLDDLYRGIRRPASRDAPPLASDVAMAGAKLRGALSSTVIHADPELSLVRKGKRGERWPKLPPLDAIRVGIPFGVVLHQGIRVALHQSLATGFRVPVRDALGRGPVPVCWYGQQDAPWIAYYDVLHRLGLARYRPDDLDHLAHWAALARSCGWWWPGEDVCVVVERPEAVSVEPVPGTWHDEVQVRSVRYRDGWRPV
ncbi:hypothetical protein FXF65_21420 [Actinomadura syzygii]|uniref:DUF6745 domain-containing protein n=1 Tax=Actinomadura syzygii TaxID=1427538 RepID=A0A5D0U365_9ACTN|nr:hypothetical protein FXF65_21420 [Actinomadura syzygii]